MIISEEVKPPSIGCTNARKRPLMKYFCNTHVALHVSFTTPITVDTKMIKNCLRSYILQSHMIGLAIISIEKHVSDQFDAK